MYQRRSLRARAHFSAFFKLCIVFRISFPNFAIFLGLVLFFFQNSTQTHIKFRSGQQILQNLHQIFMDCKGISQMCRELDEDDDQIVEIHRKSEKLIEKINRRNLVQDSIQFNLV